MISLKTRTWVVFRSLCDLKESHWNSLESLNVQRRFSPNSKDFKCLSELTQDCLKSIEELKVSVGKDEFKNNFACWRKLRKIHVELLNVSSEEVLGAIADGVKPNESNLFPSLETVLHCVLLSHVFFRRETHAVEMWHRCSFYLKKLVK